MRNCYYYRNMFPYLNNMSTDKHGNIFGDEIWKVDKCWSRWGSPRKDEDLRSEILYMILCRVQRLNWIYGWLECLCCVLIMIILLRLLVLLHKIIHFDLVPWAEDPQLTSTKIIILIGWVNNQSISDELCFIISTFSLCVPILKYKLN